MLFYSFICHDHFTLLRFILYFNQLNFRCKYDSALVYKSPAPLPRHSLRRKENEADYSSIRPRGKILLLTREERERRVERRGRGNRKKEQKAA
jgi:hypothetical protein